MKSLHKRRPYLSGLLLCCFLSGCSHLNIPEWHAYRATIEQGHRLDQSQINQLKPGMSQQQVRQLLGFPLLQPAIKTTMLDYPYYLQPGRGPVLHRLLHLEFRQGKLVAIDGDYRPN